MSAREVEQLGLRLLADELARDRLRVETPAGDPLVDLLAWTDGRRRPVPSQMLAASRQKFGVYRKHSSRPGLIMAYVWNVGLEGSTVSYAMYLHEAEAIAEALGWTQTRSWRDRAYMTTSRPERSRAPC